MNIYLGGNKSKLKKTSLLRILTNQDARATQGQQVYFGRFWPRIGNAGQAVQTNFQSPTTVQAGHSHPPLESHEQSDKITSRPLV